MVVFPALVLRHFHRGAARRAVMARVRVRLLPQGAGAGTERPQAEGTESRATGQTGVRGNVHDRSERLGWRTYIRPNYHWTNTREYLLHLIHTNKYCILIDVVPNDKVNPIFFKFFSEYRSNNLLKA